MFDIVIDENFDPSQLLNLSQDDKVRIQQEGVRFYLHTDFPFQPFSNDDDLSRSLGQRFSEIVQTAGTLITVESLAELQNDNTNNSAGFDVYIHCETSSVTSQNLFTLIREIRSVKPLPLSRVKVTFSDSAQDTLIESFLKLQSISYFNENEFLDSPEFISDLSDLFEEEMRPNVESISNSEMKSKWTRIFDGARDLYLIFFDHRDADYDAKADSGENMEDNQEPHMIELCRKSLDYHFRTAPMVRSDQLNAFIRTIHQKALEHIQRLKASLSQQATINNNDVEMMDESQETDGSHPGLRM